MHTFVIGILFNIVIPASIIFIRILEEIIGVDRKVVRSIRRIAAKLDKTVATGLGVGIVIWIEDCRTLGNHHFIAWASIPAIVSV